MRAFFRDLSIAALTLGLLLAAFVWARFEFSHLLPSRQFGLSGLAAVPATDLVLIGSSRTRQGYDPTLFAAKGCDAFVLGYNGLSPAMLPPLVEAALAARPDPEVLWVIEASPIAVLRPPVLQDTRMFLQLPPAQKRQLLMRLQRVDRQFDLGTGLTLLLRADNELLLGYPLARPFLERGSYRGGYVDKRTAELTAADFLRLQDRSSLGAGAKPRAEQLAGLEETIAILRSHHARHVFVGPPTPQPLASSPAVQAAGQQLLERFGSAGELYVEGGNLLDQRLPANFSDSAHLSIRGRAAYTSALADKFGQLGLTGHCRPAGAIR